VPIVVSSTDRASRSAERGNLAEYSIEKQERGTLSE